MSSTNNSNKDNTSTLQSYIDSATGAVQSAIGSLTGSGSDQIAGDNKKAKADAEYDASHATAKLGGVTATGSGVAVDNQQRTEGSWDQTVGAGKETLGGLIGSESLKQSGRQQNLEGQQKEAAGQVKDAAAGISDRVTGAVGSAISGLTGNQQAQAAYDQQHGEGKALFRGVQSDLNKQAEGIQKSQQ